MIIKTQRLIIRDFASEDWVAVHQYASLGDILIYEPWGPNTKEQTIEFIQQAIIDAQEKPRKIYEFAITLASTGLLIGGCGVRIKYHKPDEVNLGYVIHPSYWRKGYATEACVALITFAQEQMSSSRLVATCDEFNIASQRVLEKCGMKRMKVSPISLKFKNRKSRTFHYEYLP